VHTVVFNVHL